MNCNPRKSILHLTAVTFIAVLSMSAGEKGDGPAVDELTRVASVRTAAEVQSYLSKQGEKIAVIKFWASWCYPCRIYREEFHKVAAMTKYARKVKFMTFDADRAPGATRELRVRALPATLIFRKGMVESMKTGVIEAEDLERMVDEAVKK